LAEAVFGNLVDRLSSVTEF